MPSTARASVRGESKKRPDKLKNPQRVEDRTTPAKDGRYPRKSGKVMEQENKKGEVVTKKQRSRKG